MKKTRTVLAFISVAVLFFLAALCVKAQDDKKTKKLTPAFDVLASEQRMVKSGLMFENVCFTETDFKQCMGVAEIDYVTVSEIPEESAGFLAVGSMIVGKGQTVYGEMLGMLEFVPASDDVEIASFTFSGDASTSGADITCTVRLLEKVNYAPTVASVHENRLSMSVLSGKSGCGTLTAQDPEGDAVRYEIVKYPSHGVISELDTSNGKFTYVSNNSYTGEDSFVYVAVDEYGNYTGTARVSVNVTADREGIVFSDLTVSQDLSAASVMVSREIMDAKVQGGEYIFSPELRIKRADFIAMAMKAAGKKPKEDISALDEISDLGSVSAERKKYIAAALEGAYLTPEINGKGEKCLRPDDMITKAEAAAILSKLCGYEKRADDISVFADFGTVDSGVVRCLSAMYEYGIIDFDNGMIKPNEHITRESCARMLYKFIQTQ